jgi:hypothetical protein
MTLVSGESGIVASEAFFRRLTEALTCLCRIEIPLGHFKANGFLVGPKAVLTNWHVVSEIEKLEDPTQASAVFPKIGTDKQIQLAVDWRIDSSPEDDLDFALLNLSKAPPFDWLGLFPIPIKMRRKIWIPQHATHSDNNFAFGEVLSFNPRSGGVAHDAATQKGSSGSPIFTDDGELIALHQGGDADNGKWAIALHPIWQQLERNHLLAHIPPPHALSPASALGRNGHEGLQAEEDQQQEKRKRVASCKQAHEALHRLQFSYSALSTLQSSFPQRQSVQEAKYYFENLERLCGELRMVFGGPAFEAVDTSWIEDSFRQAINDFSKALKTRSPVAFDQAMRTLEQMLDIAPVLVDNHLRTQAQGIRTGPELPRRIDEHKRWQALDTQLRYFERTALQPRSEQPDAWNVLSRKLDGVLVGDTKEPWADELKSAAGVLKAATENCDYALVANSFNELQTRARVQFLSVDQSLKKLCEALQ